MSPTVRNVDDDVMEQFSDRCERRLLEETSKLEAKISDVRLEVAGLRSDMREGFGDVRTEVRTEIGAIRADMARDRFELLKWAFAFWIGQFFATAALFTALARR